MRRQGKERVGKAREKICVTVGNTNRRVLENASDEEQATKGRK